MSAAVAFDVAQLPERLRSKIRVADDGCWMWTGSKGPVTGPRAGDIGPVRRRVDLEPMPETEPVHEPSPEPVRVPEPAR